MPMLALLLGLIAGAADAAPIVRLAEVRGTIDPATSDHLKAAIHAAETENAEALIVELDTPGGLVSSVREMAQSIDQARVPVVVYVTPAGASATSAGALLMLASHVTAMAEGTNVGAAHPVDQSGKDVPGAMGEKVVNDTAAFARSLAELRGRDAKVAEEVVRKSISMTAAEAAQRGLADLIVDSRAELLLKLDGRVVKTRQWQKTLTTRGAEVRLTEMTWGQKLLHLIANPNISAILMTLAMLLIYVEVSHPGITVAGVAGAVCLLLAFMSFQVLPIRTGGLALLILGMALLIAEVFVTTGGALAVGGLVSFALGLLWVVDPGATDLVLSWSVWIPLVLGMAGTVGVIAFAASRTRKLAGEARARMGGGGPEGLMGYLGEVQAVSSDGLSGKAVIRGEVWDIGSDGPLQVGDRVEVLRAQGFKVQVRRRQQ